MSTSHRFLTLCLLMLAFAFGGEARAQFKAGDRVKIDHHRKEVTGVVVKSNRNFTEVLIDEDQVTVPRSVPAGMRERWRTTTTITDHVQLLEEKRDGSSDAAHQMRIWNDRTGRFSVRAAFREVKGENVVLERDDKRRIEVPLAKLSDEDQKYINGLSDDQENPFATAPLEDSESGAASEVPMKKASLHGMKIVRPQNFTKWTFEPSAETKAGRVEGLATPATSRQSRPPTRSSKRSTAFTSPPMGGVAW